MMLCYQFSQFRGARVQAFDVVVAASALEQLLNEIVFSSMGGRVLKCQVSASKLLKGNSKIIFRVGCLQQLPDFWLLGFGSTMKIKLRRR